MDTRSNGGVNLCINQLGIQTNFGLADI